MDTVGRRVAALAASGLLLTGVGVGMATASAKPGTHQTATPTATPSASTSASVSASASASARASATASASASASATASATASDAPSSSVAAATSAGATPTASPTVTATRTGSVPVTTSGQSQVLTASQQSAKVGAIFSSSSITPGNHHCTASVVDSPAGDVIVTAAHCLGAGTSSSGSVFVPGYRDGSAPAGVWAITQVVEGSAWTGDGDQDDDVAFALVAPQNGQSLEDAVGGGYTLSTSGTTDATVQMTGYPSATDEPITCTGSASAYSSTQLVIGCTAFTGGTSGTAWLAGYDSAADAGSIIGVIGGYQEGGDTADTSYSIVFGPDTLALYQQATAA